MSNDSLLLTGNFELYAV